MSQLSKNMNIIANENNYFFLKRSYDILPNLDKKLQPHMISILKELEVPINVDKAKIIFIPVSHKLNFNQKEEKLLNKNISEILKAKYQNSDALVIGETVDGEFSIKNRKKQVAETLKKLVNLGVLPPIPNIENHELTNLLPGFESAVLNFSNKNDAQVLGVESIDGAIIATSLDSKLNFIKNDLNDEYKNELKFRIGVEARTRLALNRSMQRITKKTNIIFFQGAFHLSGVKSWCKRNKVELEVIVPKVLKPYFKGKKDHIEFIY